MGGGSATHLRPELAGDLACLDAGRAHVEPLGRLPDLGADALNVGVPAARGAAVRVRHVVAEARPLAAHIADGSHGIAPFGGSEACHRDGMRLPGRTRLSELRCRARLGRRLPTARSPRARPTDPASSMLRYAGG